MEQIQSKMFGKIQMKYFTIESFVKFSSVWTFEWSLFTKQLFHFSNIYSTILFIFYHNFSVDKTFISFTRANFPFTNPKDE